MVNAINDREEPLRLRDYLVLHPTDWKSTRLSLNDRLHFRANAERVKFWRELAGLSARGLGRYPAGRVVIVYRFPDDARREVSNLQSTSKAIVDGLVDAGIFPDDSDDLMVGPDNRRDPVNGPHRATVLIYA